MHNQIDGSEWFEPESSIIGAVRSSNMSTNGARKSGFAVVVPKIRVTSAAMSSPIRLNYGVHESPTAHSAASTPQKSPRIQRCILDSISYSFFKRGLKPAPICIKHPANIACLSLPRSCLPGMTTLSRRMC